MFYSDCSTSCHWGCAVMIRWYGSLSCCMCQNGQALCSPFHSSSSAPPPLCGLCTSCPRGAIGGVHACVCVWPSVYTSEMDRMRWWRRGMGSHFWENKIEIACMWSPGASPRQRDYSDSLLGRHLAMWKRNIGIYNTASMTLNCPRSRELPHYSNIFTALLCSRDWLIISDEAGQRSAFLRWFRLACDLRSIKTAVNLLLRYTEAESVFKCLAALSIILYRHWYTRGTVHFSRIPVFFQVLN